MLCCGFSKLLSFTDGKSPVECRVRLPRPNSVVLVVEDDRQTREMYRAALMAAGFVVVAVEDGLDALRVLEHKRPNAVVLDLGLPRLPGIDVAQDIGAQPALQDVPIIVVTGQDADLNPQDFACILRKPVDSDQLITAVTTCLRSRRPKAHR
jgi:DNA-binding response OmpR family regulator